MKNISPYKLLEARPLPAPFVAMLRDVDAVAKAADVEWFVGGATARDIMLVHMHDINPTRATEDVDIGVCIESWTNHERLTSELVATGRFTRNEREEQRLDYTVAETGERAILDVVPFGGLEDGGDEIAWPPDQSVRMSVAGFAEAIDAALPIEIATDVIVLVASLPAQAMLKILAWRARGAASRKDATDLRFLISNYAAINLKRLYDDAFELIEQYDYNPDIAGAALLARDMAAVVTPGVREKILIALQPEAANPLILDHILGAGSLMLDLQGGATIEPMFRAFSETFSRSARQ